MTKVNTTQWTDSIDLHSSSADYQMNAKDQIIVMALPGNTVCCDCGTPNPDWASITFGILFCLKCSGVHRSLGTHISFVRSVDMDSWSEDQIKIMKAGGNDHCNEFLLKYDQSIKDPFTSSIAKKYDNPVAQLYCELLRRRASSDTSSVTHVEYSEEEISVRLKEMQLLHRQQQEAMAERKRQWEVTKKPVSRTSSTASNSSTTSLVDDDSEHLDSKSEAHIRQTQHRRSTFFTSIHAAVVKSWLNRRKSTTL